MHVLIDKALGCVPLSLQIARSPVAVHQLPVTIDEDGVPAVVRRCTGDGCTRLIVNTFRPSGHRHAVHPRVATITITTLRYRSIIVQSLQWSYNLNTSVQHDHPSLQWLRLIVSETVWLLDLRKPYMFHFLCATMYIQSINQSYMNWYNTNKFVCVTAMQAWNSSSGTRVRILGRATIPLGKLFTHTASPVSQLQETGVQKGVFGAKWLWWLSALD